MTTPLVSFSGLASGLDTASIVEQLVNLERRPIELAQSQQQNLNRISGRLGTIQSQLNTLKESSEGLDDSDTILGTRASSSDEDTLAVSTTGSAPLGRYTVEVTQVAQAERTYSDAVSSRDTALNDASLLGAGFTGGTLSIQVGTTTTVDVTVEATDTLESLVGRINSSDADVTAGIFFDGTNYRMQVGGNDTGTDNAITFSETGFDLGLTDPLNEVVEARNALFTIDGFSVSRASNNVSDVIDGLTLDINDTTTSPISIDIERDTEDFEGRVQGFVDSYNAVVRSINSEFAFLGEARIGDSLSGDSTLRGLQSRLRSLAGDTIGELDASYNRLGSVGVSFEQDGTLSLDTEELREALADDPSAVVSLFVDDRVNDVEGFMPRFAELVDEYTISGTGILSSRIDSIGSRVRDIDDSIERMERRVEGYEDQLRQQFASLEQLVSELNAQGSQLAAIQGGL